ncbi:42884_t:CDS:2, partial [Gigaspora margarita]
YRIPFALLLYFSTPASEQKQTPPNLKQRVAASYIKTIVETLPLWLIRSIFDLTGVIEQLVNGMYDGEERDKWCRRLKGGDGWDGYLIAENAETDDVGENADMVILYVHGGGLNAGGPLISLMVFVKWIEAWKLSHGANTHILSLEYGLSPEHPFPSARDSLLECYQWLVNEKGINPSKIAIAGDSIGGNLATLAALELLNNPNAYKNTPLPSHPACPQVSPLFDCRLRGLPKVWVCVGGYEVFLEDIMSFVKNARNQDVSVELVVEQDNMHNYAILFPLSRHGGAQKAMKYMSRFLFGEKSVIGQYPRN